VIYRTKNGNAKKKCQLVVKYTRMVSDLDKVVYFMCKMKYIFFFLIQFPQTI